MKKHVSILFLCSCLFASVNFIAAIDSAIRMPLIIDDDGSFDGTIAMLYLTAHPDFEVRAWTVSPGEAHPSKFAENLVRVQTMLGLEGIPVAAGPEKPYSGNNEFPRPWRNGPDMFWHLRLPWDARAVDVRSAPQCIVDIIKSSSIPVKVLVTGTLTNIALALDIDPTIKSNIDSIHIMGGALRVPGNLSEFPGYTNQVSEWNIWVDPEAAFRVFESGIPIRLVPLDATNAVLWDTGVADALAQQPDAISQCIASILRVQFQSFGSQAIPVWDLVAAIDLAHPELSGFEALRVRIEVNKGGNEGQMVIQPGLTPNISVCIPSGQEGYHAAFLNDMRQQQ